MASEKQSVLMEHTLQELIYRNSGNKRRKPTVLALITTHLIGMDSGLSFLRRISSEEATIRFSIEDEVLTHISIEEIVRISQSDNWIPQHSLSEKTLSHADVVLIPILSFSIMSDILSFNEQRPFVRLVLTALLTGKTVIALKTGANPYHPLWRLKGIDKGSNGLKRNLYNQMIQLKNMGIKLIGENEKLPNLSEKKTVINEDAIRYFQQKKIHSYVVTKEKRNKPHTKDTAKELNRTQKFE